MNFTLMSTFKVHTNNDHDVKILKTVRENMLCCDNAACR